MRLTVLLGCAALLAGCTTKEAPPASDSLAADSAASRMSLESVAGVWNVNVMPVDRDTVVTTYIINTTDTAEWIFAFPNGKPVPMRPTGIEGDTILSETDWFDSSVRPGLKTRTEGRTWLQDGKLMGKIVAHYQTTGPDTVRLFRTEGTRTQ